MALSYNLGYQESISVHPTRRQNFAGKVYSILPNIWEWLIYEFIYQTRPSKFSQYELDHRSGKEERRVKVHFDYHDDSGDDDDGDEDDAWGRVA